MLEIISSLARLENKNLDDVISVAKSKREKRGGFENKIFLNDGAVEDKEKDMFLFKELQKIFEKIIDCFKDFYIKI